MGSSLGKLIIENGTLTHVMTCENVNDVIYVLPPKK